MLNVMLRILAWVSITLVTTISANPIPDLVRDEKGFTRLNYDLATVLDPSRLLSVEDKMLGRRLRGLPVPPRETTMRHFCLPSPRRNPACVRCDDLYTRPVSDEHFAKVRATPFNTSPLSDDSERY